MSNDHPLKLAVDVLERLTTERSADREELVGGAIALAMHVALHPDADASGVIVDLEQLVLGNDTLERESVEQMLRVVAQLRAAVGVH